MTAPEPKYSKEKHARMGSDLYEQKIRPLVEAGNHGKIVAIDVDTGEYEVAADVLTAGNQLRARLPNSQTWFVRVGYPYVHRFSFGIRPS